MPIVAVCGNCSKRYTLDDKFAGKSVKCRTCKETFSVPGEDDPTVLAADASPGVRLAAKLLLNSTGGAAAPVATGRLPASSFVALGVPALGVGESGCGGLVP